MTSSRSKNLENLGGICLFYEMPQWRDSAIVDLQRIIELRGAKAYLKLEAVGEEGMHIARIGPSASLEEMTPGYDTAAIAPALALDATQDILECRINLFGDFVRADDRVAIAVTRERPGCGRFSGDGEFRLTVPETGDAEGRMDAKRLGR